MLGHSEDIMASFRILVAKCTVCFKLYDAIMRLSFFSLVFIMIIYTYDIANEALTFRIIQTHSKAASSPLTNRLK
jgi:hypothetical protein